MNAPDCIQMLKAFRIKGSTLRVALSCGRSNPLFFIRIPKDSPKDSNIEGVLTLSEKVPGLEPIWQLGS